MDTNCEAIILPDGGRYLGDVSDSGKPEGAAGVCVWKEKGLKYIGHWCDGMMHGVGTMYYRDGKEVRGVWYEGELIYEFVKDYQSPIISEEPNRQTMPQDKKQRIAALLIGNDDYPSNPLTNCIYDVTAIGKKMQSIGADVKIMENATNVEMRKAINDLCEKSNEYKHVFLYYSGHGMTNQGRHYICAIDEASDPSPYISLEEIDEKLSAKNFEDIIIVSDACCSIRNTEGNSSGVKSNGKTLMAFSTMLGQSSYDFRAPNSHSPFAVGLLEYIDKPMDVVDMFREVNRLTIAVAEREIGKIQMPTLLIGGQFPSNYYLCPI